MEETGGLSRESFDVCVLGSATIKPIESTKRMVMSLSGLDRVSPALMYTVFFYDSSSVNGDEVVNRLKIGLEKVLVKWYPAAGRFCINKDTSNLEIDCNDAGTVLVEASMNAALKDLGQLWDYQPFYEKLVPKNSSEKEFLADKPLVVVQVTKFACGGISIGFGSSHSLFDGLGAFNFLSAWASMCNVEKQEEVSFEPNHSRKGLVNSNDTELKKSISEHMHSMPVHDLSEIPVQAVASDDKSWEKTLQDLSHMNKEGCSLKTIFIKKEMIDALKEEIEAQSDESSKSRFTTFDVLAAHIWRARVKALEISPETKICLQYPVDSRNRLRPQLGITFTGNAFVLASTSCLAGEVMKEHILCTARRIKAAKDAVVDPYIRAYMSALESSDKFFPSMRELTIISDWRNLPFHSMDFGWGEAACASPLATPVPQTVYVMLTPPHHSPGYHIRLGLSTAYLQSFQDHIIRP